MDEQTKAKYREWFMNLVDYGVCQAHDSSIAVIYDHELATDEEYEQQLKDLAELKTAISTLLE